jgi:hypothetical protein
MPPALFQGVVAHELGHAWLHINTLTRLSQKDEEGFCELMSFAYYSGLGTDDSRYRMKCIEENPDPIYGEGFREVRAIQRRYGFVEFIRLLEGTRRMPR